MGFDKINNFLVAHYIPDTIACSYDESIIPSDLLVSGLDWLSSDT
jgi:hypothetical protein